MQGSFRKFQMKQLMESLESIFEAGKSAIIFDLQGSLSTFFNYKGLLVECHKLKLRQVMQKATKEEIIEALRKGYVGALKSENTLVYYLDKINMPFKQDYTAKNFPAEFIFDRSKNSDREFYKPPLILKPEEDVDRFQNNEFYATKPVDIVLLLKIDDESEIQERLNELKTTAINIEHFEVAICIP